MAVCENATGQYYKVLLEDSYIQDGFVFVAAVRYPNQEERDREKAREEQLSSFLENAKQRYSEILSEGQDQNTDSETDYEEEFERVIYTVENFSTIISSQPPAVITISDKTKQEMISLGFSDDFISNPVLVIDYITVNCGADDKTPLSLEYLYEKLKGRMSKITNV